MDTLFAVLWSDGQEHDAQESSRLRGEISRAVARPLKDLGVDRYLVNVRDTEVAGALIDVQVTQRTFRAALRARVPVASAAACQALLDSLRSLGPVSAWSVTASEPLPVADPESIPTPIPEEGVRCEGMANVAFLRRPERVTREEWLKTWLEDHTTVAIETQSTTGYTQHVVVRALTPDAPELAGIVEEVFPIGAATDLGVFFDSRGDDARFAAHTGAMTASTQRFLEDGTVDAIPTGRYVMGVPGHGV